MNRIKESIRRFCGGGRAGVILQRSRTRSNGRDVLSADPPAAPIAVWAHGATMPAAPLLKYGVTRDYVLGLQAVLADALWPPWAGARIRTKRLRLDAVDGGFGRLVGVVTEVILKLLPLPPFRAFAMVDLIRWKAGRALFASYCRGFLRARSKWPTNFAEGRVRRTGSKRLAGSSALLMVELDAGRNHAERRGSLGPITPGARPYFYAARLWACGVRKIVACAASFRIPCAIRGLSN